MAQAKRSDQWGHTSSLIATIVNLVRDPKKHPKPYQPGEFDPTKPKTKKVANGMAALKGAYVNSRN